MAADLPFAVWQDAVHNQKYEEECNETNQHTEVYNISGYGGYQRKTLYNMCVDPVAEYKKPECGN